MTRPRSSRFSPDVVDPADLERTFVGREQLLKGLAEDVAATALAGGARYELIVGPRGAGKSHLMALLKHRLKGRPDLAGGMLLAALGEEENVASLLDLLVRILRAMPEEPGLPLTATQVGSILDAPHRDGMERVVRLIEGRVGDRALVIVVENLDLVFQAIRKEGQSVLRNVLQSHPRWSVVATSRTFGAPFTRTGSPFFRSFVHRPLHPLDPVQCRALLVRLAEVQGDPALRRELETPEGLARVRTIHHLAGGSPRAMALIYPYLSRRTLEDLEAAFFDLADELTPYFQEQVARLPPGQRPLLEHLAEGWRPVSVGELARLTLTTHQATSSNLRYLGRDRLADALTVGRERFYEVAEPLHRIARAMKRPDGAPAVFARVLRCWYTEREIEEQWRRHREEPREADVWTLARSAADEVTEYDRSCVAEVGRLMAEHRVEEAVDLARTWYARTSHIVAVIHLMAVLSSSHRDDDLGDVAMDAYRRFGGRVGQPILALVRRPKSGVLASLRDEIQADFLGVPGEDPFRDYAIEALLGNGELEDGVLDALCDERVARVRAEGSARRSLGSVTLLELILRGRHRWARRLAEAQGWSHLTTDERVLVVRAMVADGATDTARAALPEVEAGIEDPRKLAELRIRVRLELDDADLAADLAEQAVTEWPEDEEIRGLAAEATVQARRAADAFRHAQWLVRRRSGDAEAWYRLARARMLRGTTAQAVEPLRKCLEIDPSHDGAREYLFAVHLLTGNLDEARAVAAPGWRHGSLARAVVDSLDPEAEAAPALGAREAPKGFSGALIPWWRRIEERFELDREGTTQVLRTAFRPPVHPSWSVELADALARVVPHALADDGRRTRIAELVDLLDPLVPLGEAVAVPRAILALPTSVRPYARLAAPERAWARALLEEAGDKARAWLEHLPTEPAPREAD